MKNFIYGAAFLAMINPCFAMEDDQNNEHPIMAHLRAAEKVRDLEKNGATQEEFAKAHQEALDLLPQDMSSAYYPTREIPFFTLLSAKEMDQNNQDLIDSHPIMAHLRAAEKVRDLEKNGATKAELVKAAQEALDLLPQNMESAYLPELKSYIAES